MSFQEAPTQIPERVPDSTTESVGISSSNTKEKVMLWEFPTISIQETFNWPCPLVVDMLRLEEVMLTELTFTCADRFPSEYCMD